MSPRDRVPVRTVIKADVPVHEGRIRIPFVQWDVHQDGQGYIETSKDHLDRGDRTACGIDVSWKSPLRWLLDTPREAGPTEHDFKANYCRTCLRIWAKERR
jgi:hypothetical protein